MKGSHFSRTDYSEVIARYNVFAKKAFDEGKKPSLSKGLIDVLRVVHTHNARSNPVLYKRAKERGLNTFIRSDGNKNFDEIVKWIICNVKPSTRTFSKEGCQSQIAGTLGVSQSTISRMLDKMVVLGMIRHAFVGDNDPTDSSSGLVRDKSGITLNNIYVVNDDFALLVAGPGAGNKMNIAFAKADEQAELKTGEALFERLLTIRNMLWEGTIERRVANISVGSLRKTIKKVTDRSRATAIILKRAEKRGELIGLADSAIQRLVNIRLDWLGFGSTPAME